MYKVIIQGRLDFGNEKTYVTAQKLYVQRMESYYKNEVIFNKPEEHFDDNQYYFLVERTVQFSSDKYWMNTVNLLDNLAQYALAGEIKMWMMDQGEAIRTEIISPNSEKSVVSATKKAIKLLDEKEKQDQLEKTLRNILTKYPAHSLAQAMMGRMYARRKDMVEANKYFDLALENYSHNAYAHLWRGKMYMQQERYAEALIHLTETVKVSVAQESVHWTGRRLKGLCYFQLNNWEDCAFEWRLFTRRAFKKEDSNFYWLRAILIGLGRAYLMTGKKGEAVLAFDQALDHDSLFDNTPQETIEALRDQALGKVSKSTKKVTKSGVRAKA